MAYHGQVELDKKKGSAGVIGKSVEIECALAQRVRALGTANIGGICQLRIQKILVDFWKSPLCCRIKVGRQLLLGEGHKVQLRHFFSIFPTKLKTFTLRGEGQYTLALLVHW